MENTVTLYKNYGCLTAEKEMIWTGERPEATAICSEKVVVKVPEGWELCENEFGGTLIESPYNGIHRIDDVVKRRGENPHFVEYDSDGKFHSVKLEIVESYIF